MQGSFQKERMQMSDDFRHSFDRDALSDYLSAHVAGFNGLDAITRFTGGQSNPTYKITSGGRDYVMRAKPPGTLLKSAHAVDREYRVMRALADTCVPVPKMYHLSEDNSPLGTQFFVMEMVDGTVHWDPGLPGFSQQSRAAAYGSLNATLADLHDIDPASIGLSDYGRPGNYFERQLTRWSQQYRASESAHLPQVDQLIGWLERNMVGDDGAISIVHGDYRLDNVMLAQDAPCVVAVLDWELSTLGHPMADLAYQCMGLRLPNQGTARGLAGIDRAPLGIPSEQDYVAAYCQRRRLERPENWPFYLSLSYFRLLAILQGVVARAAAGNASNPGDMAALEAAIPQLAQAALEIAESQSPL